LSICVLGGTGFLGTRLVARLIKDGHRVTVLSRDREQHKHLLVLPGLTLENCDVYDEAQLSERFRGKDVVINLIGILNERGFGGGGFRRAHTELTRGVLQAARSAGVARLLQVSALKAAVDAPSYYLRSKGEAEQADPRASARALDWTIFQPSVMFGPGDSFLNRFADAGAVPWCFRSPSRTRAFSPCSSTTSSRRCCAACTAAPCSRQTYELGGPQVYTLREIVALVAKLTGRRRWIIGLAELRRAAAGVRMNFVPGRPVLQRQLSLAHGRQRLHRGRLRETRDQAAVDAGLARQYLGRLRGQCAPQPQPRGDRAQRPRPELAVAANQGIARA
jgi:uncharacterized protein YbjT (DUF2867 family)